MERYIAKNILKYIYQHEDEYVNDREIYVYFYNKIKNLRRKRKNINVKIYFVEDPETEYWSKPISETISRLQALGLIKRSIEPISYSLTNKAREIFHLTK